MMGFLGLGAGGSVPYAFEKELKGDGSCVAEDKETKKEPKGDELGRGSCGAEHKETTKKELKGEGLESSCGVEHKETAEELKGDGLKGSCGTEHKETPKELKGDGLKGSGGLKGTELWLAGEKLVKGSATGSGTEHEPLEHLVGVDVGWTVVHD